MVLLGMEVDLLDHLLRSRGCFGNSCMDLELGESLFIGE